MPLYHFDLWHGLGWSVDETGVELADDESARRYGYEVMRDISRNKERETRTFCVAVRDATRQGLFTLPFSRLSEALRQFEPHMRATVETAIARRRALREAILNARLAVQMTRATIARAHGKPHLVVVGSDASDPRLRDAAPDDAAFA